MMHNFDLDIAPFLRSCKIMMHNFELVTSKTQNIPSSDYASGLFCASLVKLYLDDDLVICSLENLNFLMVGIESSLGAKLLQTEPTFSS